MSGARPVRPAVRARVPGAVAVLLAVTLAGACSGSGHAAKSDVIERAAAAMHVDADLARYSLELTADGGSLTVTIDDQFGSDQIEKVRVFLRRQPALLARGDVGGFRALLGDDAPGLAAIARDHAELHTAYVDDAEGARLELRSTRPELVAAIHRMLNDILVHFGKLATVPATEPDTTTTTGGQKVPSDFLG